MSAGLMAFNGHWDSRAAELRSDPDALARLLTQGAARVLPVWRGKPQLRGTGEATVLGWVSADAAVLKQAQHPFLFLGMHQDQPLFAADISAWEPDALDRGAMAMFMDTTIQHYPGTEAGLFFGELRQSMAHLPAPDAALAATARAMFNWHRSHGFCSACGQPSGLAMAGWERHCPSCGAKHFPRTDPVVIMLVTHGNDLLLGRSPGWPDGMYSTLAGFIEPGETLENAVRREVLEETGIRTTDIGYITSQPWPFPSSLMLGCVARATSRAITLDDELEDARWVTREQVLRAWSGDDPAFIPARKGAIAHHLIGLWLAGRVRSAYM
ncbi:NAD(+) diphosphatase [Roseinatronobacter alkalisoli]|uniref:NAD(+) diphosphatase n=1 Tax=Roseinatronobacter alkalisoli TaxID=3028235 RepID=A0ABT5T641_9RHOB|nr:NAD(+) diphosphatase [Roseinatronobacter sp. HJB301]MDD7970585.1 NAD(+) diphosphatase [Roseinatronobacter sp. HJB301]